MASTTITKFAHLQIPLEDVLRATNNFHDDHIIGRGGFGYAYKGQLLKSGRLMKVVALRLDRKHGEGDVEFWTEISMLSHMKHTNIVSIIGFCDEKDEKIIVTTYQAKGSLREHLDNPNLTWTQRLRICVGVARALSYIHYEPGRGYGVIHRNINSSTIVLDDNWKGMLSGFKISIRQLVYRMNRVHICEPMGTIGYMDPTIEKTGGVTHKSDIYSFSVVLFEIMCGRQAFIKEDTNMLLAPLAKYHHENGTLENIIHRDLWNQMSSQSLFKFSEAAYRCLNDDLALRPDADNIVEELEKALEYQLQYEDQVRPPFVLSFFSFFFSFHVLHFIPRCLEDHEIREQSGDYKGIMGLSKINNSKDDLCDTLSNTILFQDCKECLGGKKEMNFAEEHTSDVFNGYEESSFNSRVMSSSALFHVTHNTETLKNLKVGDFGKVRLANNEVLDVTSMVDIDLKTPFGITWTLNNVSVVPNLENMLFSVRKLDDQEHNVKFSGGQWKVKGNLIIKVHNLGEKPRATCQVQAELTWKGFEKPVKGICDSGNSSTLPAKDLVKNTNPWCQITKFNCMELKETIFTTLDEQFSGQVKFGDGYEIDIKGNVNVSDVTVVSKNGEYKTFCDVFCTSKLKTNLLSLGQLDEEGCKVEIANGILSNGQEQVDVKKKTRKENNEGASKLCMKYATSVEGFQLNALENVGARGFSPVLEFPRIFLLSYISLLLAWGGLLGSLRPLVSQQVVSEFQSYEVRHREILSKNQLWFVASSSQGCVDSIWITQDGKPTPVPSKDSSGTSKNDEEWEDLDLRAASAIRLCLEKNVLENVHGISTSKDLWEKLEQLYQGKDILNRLYLKEQFHTLRMDGETTILDHLSVLNNIMAKLEAIGVKVEDKDKSLRLILSLTSSYEHMMPILMYGKETSKYADVFEKLLSEEKRLGSGGHTSLEGTILICRNGKKKHSHKILVWWKCGQSGHLKRICPGGADSANSSKSANNVSVVVDGDDFF
ncbi:hypothetical protein QVD17_41940 [Tagetes erecta]|uniref:Protein kinase domain-containing protein n=1 Tax=Tagetes erecta TaxID=13708 RepID=A0AAD8JL93_TARER|nr:hypothetical protein QVD17_41940 [Tagetes erecta]